MDVKISQGHSTTRWSNQIGANLDVTVFNAFREDEDRMRWHNIVKMKVMDGHRHEEGALLKEERNLYNTNTRRILLSAVEL